MKGKIELLTNSNFFFILMVEMLQKAILSLCNFSFLKNVKIGVRFGALEEVFMSYRPHGAWRTMEVLEELA
jgi:hypothetical protein